MKKLLLIFLVLPLLMVAQTEKRLALVIGNSDYEFTTKLTNPVNDALLIAKTLEELEFDVILGTNLVDEDSFIDKISEFGQKRPDYDVAFVFYAGHGSQINNKNYLLPTGIKAKTEWDVEQKAVSVQSIMHFLTGMTDQVNVLILDACRDNNFEKEWGGKTRSASGKGSGLAKMKAPSGSLIAFSTTAGTTAPDGEGVNSDYTRVLAEQMKVPGISLDQVFRNVRRKIFDISNGNQQTEEATQLTGETFYLVKSNFEKQFALIDSLILDENLEYRTNDKDRLSALEIVSSILNEDSENRLALIKKGEIYTLLEDYDNALNIYNKVVESNPNDPVCYMYRGLLYSSYQDEFDNALNNALNDFNQSLKIDSMYRPSYSNRADVYFLLKDYQSALPDYTKAISLQKDNPYRYKSRAECYIKMEDYSHALIDLTSAIDLAPNDATYYVNRGNFYDDNKKESDLALKDYTTAIKISTNDYQTARALHNRALIYWAQEEYVLAIEGFTSAIDLVPNDVSFYIERAALYLELEDYKNALIDYNHSDLTKALELDSVDAYTWMTRGRFYKSIGDLDNAIKDNLKAIAVDSLYTFAYDDVIKLYLELEDIDNAEYFYTRLVTLFPKDPLYLNNRADFYKNQEKYDEALKDYGTVIEISNDDGQTSTAINNSANIYWKQEKWELCIEEYTKAIELNEEDPVLYDYRVDCYIAIEDYTNALKDLDKAIDLASETPLYYNNRADFHVTQKEYDLALKDYNLIIKLFPDNSDSYNNRALFYVLLEEYEDANEDFNKAIKLDPEERSPYFYRAKMYHRQKEYDKERLDYIKTIEMDSEDPKGYYFLALLYVNQNKNFQAISYFEKAIVKLLAGDYIITADNGIDLIELADIYIKRAEVYKNAEAIELMCEDYKNACDLGNCEMFNKNCK